MISEILLRRKNKIVLESNKACLEGDAALERDALLYAMLRNVESLGYAFSSEVFMTIRDYSTDMLTALYLELIPALKKLRGADVKYEPMYKNFPQEVAEKSEAELYINAIIHYFTFGELMPESNPEERLPLHEKTRCEEIGLGTEDDLFEIIRNLLGSPTSLSDQDKQDITAVILEKGLDRTLPDIIPLKETLAFITTMAIERKMETNKLIKYFKTATDVLRLAVAMSAGDVSLARPAKFRSFKRAERRAFMELLAGLRSPLEDMFRYREQWIRLGERIHPGEFKADKYNGINLCFTQLRSGEKPLFFGGKLEKSVGDGEVKDAVALLSARPGEFCRRLDKLLRMADAEQSQYILEEFKKVADRVAVPVLLQTMKHFETRGEEQSVRVFFPKGKLAKAMSIPYDLPPIEGEVAAEAVGVCREGIIAQLKERDSLGRVFVSEELKNYLVPFSQRSASTGSKILVRGSRIGIPKDATTIRGFIHWTNMEDEDPYRDRVDIDLSATIYDKDWKYVSHVSYTHLKDGELEAYHSGDITNGGPANGNGVAEFIDINIDAICGKGRYVVFQVYSFTGQLFSKMPHSRFGWMLRQKPASGEIFEPKTVDQLYDLNAEATVAIPAIFDCEDRSFIWCDMIKSGRDYYYGNNLESNLRGTTAVCYALTNVKKPTLWDLVMLNTQARGGLEEDRNAADIIFDVDACRPLKTLVETTEDGSESERVVQNEEIPVITPLDIDFFMGKML